MLLLIGASEYYISSDWRLWYTEHVVNKFVIMFVEKQIQSATKTFLKMSTTTSMKPSMPPLRTTPLQKLILVASALTFVAISCITAAIPLNLPRHQESKGTAESGTENINSGDTAWLLISTIFGFLVGPLTAYLYANIYGKDEHLLVTVTLVTSTIIAVLWIVLTFSLVYGEDANGQNFLGFPSTYYMFRDVGARPAAELAPTVPCSIYAVFELCFALLTPTIVAADIIERVNAFGVVFFLLAWHVVIYCPVAHITWNPHGYLFTNDVEDFAGGIVVNILASATILASNVFLDFIKAPNYGVKIPNNSTEALKFALVLWFLWFGLLAGKAHNAGPVAAQAVVNTIASVQVAVLFGYLQDRLCGGQPLAEASTSMLNNILLGLVAVTPVCGYTTVGGAMCVSVVTVLCTKLIARYLLKDGLAVNDPLDITTVHGVGGTIGFLMTAIFSYSFINPAALDGLTSGEQHPIRMHTAAALALWGCIFLATFVLHFLCDLLVPISAHVTTDRVFLPYITQDAVHLSTFEESVNKGGADGLGEHLDDEGKYNLAREISLYRKLSRYFSQGPTTGQ